MTDALPLTVRTARDADFAVLTLSLGDVCHGGKLLQTTVDFSGEVVGRGETAPRIKLARFLPAITSGVFYAFRALPSPRRQVFLSHLSGVLDAESEEALDAVANAAAFGVAKLLNREHELPPVDLRGWKLEATTGHVSDYRQLTFDLAAEASPASPPAN